MIFGRVDARLRLNPGRSGVYEVFRCFPPSVAAAKRRARPLRAYARAGVFGMFNDLTML